MKTILTVLAMLFVTMPVAAASRHRDVPLPRPNPLVVAQVATIPVKTIPYVKPIEVAQATVPPIINPDPFNVKRENNTLTTTTAPVIVQAADDGIKGWIHEALLALLAAIGGGAVWKLPGSIFGSSKPSDGTTPTVSADDKKAHIEAIAINLLKSGVPTQIVATALGLIPGNAGFASMEEKALNSAALALLSRGAIGADPVTTIVQHTNIENVVQDAVKKIDFSALLKDALANHQLSQSKT